MLSQYAAFAIGLGNQAATHLQAMMKGMQREKHTKMIHKKQCLKHRKKISQKRKKKEEK
jgi:hypothetical protein